MNMILLSISIRACNLIWMWNCIF